MTRSIPIVAVAACAVMLVGTASAQETDTTSTVERVHSGFVVTPDIKFTRIDDGTGTLVGVNVGLITDRRFLVGLGGYWLADAPRDFGLSYGGASVEWFANPRGRVDFSLRSFAGFGVASLRTGSSAFGGFRGRHGHFSRRIVGVSHGGRIQDGVYVVEPGAALHVNATDWLRVGVGAGYRIIGDAAAIDGERLQGYTATVGFQIGPH